MKKLTKSILLVATVFASALYAEEAKVEAKAEVTAEAEAKIQPIVLVNNKYTEDFKTENFVKSLQPYKAQPELTIAQNGVIMRGKNGYGTKAVLVQEVEVPEGATKLIIKANVRELSKNFAAKVSMKLNDVVATTDAKGKDKQVLTAEAPVEGGKVALVTWTLGVGCGKATPKAVPARLINYTIEAK